MDSHSGTWTLQTSDVSDLIFSSSRPLSILLTIRWTAGSTAQFNRIQVQANGVPVQDSTLGGGNFDFSRTFVLDGVNTVTVNQVAPATLGQPVIGEYQVSLL